MWVSIDRHLCMFTLTGMEANTFIDCDAVISVVAKDIKCDSMPM